MQEGRSSREASHHHGHQQVARQENELKNYERLGEEEPLHAGIDHLPSHEEEDNTVMGLKSKVS